MKHELDLDISLSLVQYYGGMQSWQILSNMGWEKLNFAQRVTIHTVHCHSLWLYYSAQPLIAASSELNVLVCIFIFQKYCLQCSNSSRIEYLKPKLTCLILYIDAMRCYILFHPAILGMHISYFKCTAQDDKIILHTTHRKLTFQIFYIFIQIFKISFPGI